MKIPGLDQIIAKIQDPRYLFLLALLLVVGSLSFFEINPWIAAMVVVGGFVLAIVISVFDYLSGSRHSARMAIALKFPPAVDPSGLRLVGCDYIIQNPRDSAAAKTAGSVRPYTAGGGWVCPVPERAKPTDVIDFTISDSGGGRWLAGPFVPDLNWPMVDAVRQE